MRTSHSALRFLYKALVRCPGSYVVTSYQAGQPTTVILHLINVGNLVTGTDPDPLLKSLIRANNDLEGGYLTVARVVGDRVPAALGPIAVWRLLAGRAAPMTAGQGDELHRTGRLLPYRPGDHTPCRDAWEVIV